MSMSKEKFGGLSKRQHLSQKVNGDMSLLQFISSHSLFSKLSKKERTEAASLIEVQRFEATDVVLRRGDHADCLLIVASGALTVVNKVSTESVVDATNTVASHNEESSYHGSMEGDSLLLRNRNFKTVETNEIYGITSLIHKAYYWPNYVTAADVTDYAIVLLLPRQAYIDSLKKNKSCFYNLEIVVNKARKQYEITCLKRVPYFKGFPDDFIQNLAKANYFELEAIDEHETFMAKGDIIQHFYVLLTGEMVVAEIDEATDMIIEYGRIKPTNFFGCTSTSLKSDAIEDDFQEAWAIYKTIKKTTILKIHVQDLKKLCLRTPTLSNKLNVDRIRYEKAKECVSKLSLFQGISESWKKYIQNNLKFVTLQPATVIKKEGEVYNQRFYIIIEGVIDVSIGGKNIASLNAGSYFGESTLLSKKPGSATLQVSTKHGLCKCLVLGGSDFLRLADNEPSVEAELQFKMKGSACPFEYLVAHPFLKTEFLKFAKKEKVEHNIEFLARIAELEQLSRSKTKKVVVRAFGRDVQVIKSRKVNLLREKAMAIYKDFFETSILNLSSSIDTQIRESFKSGDYGHLSVFQSAKAAILDILDFDKYGRFKKTEIFQNFLQNVGVYKFKNN